MKKEPVTQAEIKLVGLSARTNNKDEINPETAKIGKLVANYWSHNIAPS